MMVRQIKIGSSLESKELPMPSAGITFYNRTSGPE